MPVDAEYPDYRTNFPDTGVFEIRMQNREDSTVDTIWRAPNSDIIVISHESKGGERIEETYITENNSGHLTLKKVMPSLVNALNRDVKENPFNL